MPLEKTKSKATNGNNKPKNNKKIKKSVLILILLSLLAILIIVGCFFRYKSAIYQKFGIASSVQNEASVNNSSDEINKLPKDSLPQANKVLSEANQPDQDSDICDAKCVLSKDSNDTEVDDEGDEKSSEKPNTDISKRIDLLDQTLTSLELKSSKLKKMMKDSLSIERDSKKAQKTIRSMFIAERLIHKLRDNHPFEVDFGKFKDDEIYIKNASLIKEVIGFSLLGIPTQKDLTLKLNSLKSHVVSSYYGLGDRFVDKLKSISAKFITVVKYKEFDNNDDDSLSYMLYQIESYLKADNLAKVIHLVNTSKLKDINYLNKWIELVEARNTANQLIKRLQKFIEKNSSGSI